MNELKKMYKDSKADIVRKWVATEVPRCYEIAKLFASNAKPTASCVLNADVPAYAWDSIVDNLRHKYGIEAKVDNDRDTSYTPTVVMRGWAD